MNTLLIFFALPLATIIISIALQKVLKCPALVAGIVFAIFLIVTFIISDLNFLIATIVYTIVSFLTALLVCVICRALNSENGNHFHCSCGCGCGNNSNDEVQNAQNQLLVSGYDELQDSSFINNNSNPSYNNYTGANNCNTVNFNRSLQRVNVIPNKYNSRINILKK